MRHNRLVKFKFKKVRKNKKRKKKHDYLIKEGHRPSYRKYIIIMDNFKRINNIYIHIINQFISYYMIFKK